MPDGKLADSQLLNTALKSTQDPTGLPNRTDSTISFDDGLRRFTIAPTGATVLELWYNV